MENIHQSPISNMDILIITLIDQVVENRKYLDIIMQNDNERIYLPMIKLMYHYKMESIDTMIDYCIEKSICDKTTFLRTDTGPVFVLKMITEILLTKILNDNINFHSLEGTLLLICTHSPLELRKMCKKIFTQSNNIDDNMGYKAIISLILFKFFCSFIINMNKDSNNIRKCKLLMDKYIKNEEKKNVSQMRTLVHILIDTNAFDLNNNNEDHCYNLEKNEILLMVKKIINFFRCNITLFNSDNNLLNICIDLNNLLFEPTTPKLKSSFGFRFKLFGSVTKSKSDIISKSNTTSKSDTALNSDMTLNSDVTSKIPQLAKNNMSQSEIIIPLIEDNNPINQKYNPINQKYNPIRNGIDVSLIYQTDNKNTISHGGSHTKISSFKSYSESDGKTMTHNSVKKTIELLNSLGIFKYDDEIRTHNIQYENFVLMDEVSLQKIGINNINDILKIIRHTEKLHKY